MCKFPAKELKQERANMAELADGLTDEGAIRRCSEFVLRCDQLRLLHEEITGCGCWYEVQKTPARSV